MQKILNRELRKVQKWLEANRLALNIEKTNFVLPAQTGSNYCRENWKSQNLTRTHVRFLGVLLDSTLSWRYYLTEL